MPYTRIAFFGPLLAAGLLLLPVPAPAQTAPLSPTDQLTRDIYKELVEINTSDSVGSCTKAAEAMAARLKAAGFADADMQVIGPDPRKKNLVARLKGSGTKKPLLLLAHTDVVEARREDWTTDPFTFLEKDGWFYGRGTADDKAMAANFVSILIRFKKEHLTPDRDIILALTADEEGGKFNGVDWLVKEHHDLIDAEFAINEGGGGLMKAGKNVSNQVGASEKVFQSFRLEVRNAGGHSSQPIKDNAIYHLAGGLARLGAFDFPVRVTEVTKAYFSRMALLSSADLAADMKAVAGDSADLAAAGRLSAGSRYYNALLHTTCVATMLEGGHAENALPQLAAATVNCRMLPGDTTEQTQAAIVKVLADDQIKVTPMAPAKPSQPSPLRADVIGPIEFLTDSLWPGVVVVPTMGPGATDGLYLRNSGIPTYGVSGLFAEMDDPRAHGRDERVGVKQFFESYQFLYRLVKTLSGLK